MIHVLPCTCRMLSALIWTDYLLCSVLLCSAKQKDGMLCSQQAFADSGTIIVQYNGQYRWTLLSYRQNRCFFRVIRVGFISQQIRYRSIFMMHCWCVYLVFSPLDVCMLDAFVLTFNHRHIWWLLSFIFEKVKSCMLRKLTQMISAIEDISTPYWHTNNIIL